MSVWVLLACNKSILGHLKGLLQRAAVQKELTQLSGEGRRPKKFGFQAADIGALSV